MTLGEQIKQAREEKNYSQEELASRLEVSRQAISKWENDTAIPNGINREMLNQELGLSLSLNDDEIPVKKKNVIGIVGWVFAGILAICLLIALFYIKTRLPLVSNNSQKAELQRKEIEMSKKIVELNPEEILTAVVYIGTDEGGNVSATTIYLNCKNAISDDLEAKVIETANSIIDIDESNISVVVEVDYRPNQ